MAHFPFLSTAQWLVVLRVVLGLYMTAHGATRAADVPPERGRNCSPQRAQRAQRTAENCLSWAGAWRRDPSSTRPHHMPS